MSASSILWAAAADRSYPPPPRRLLALQAELTRERATVLVAADDGDGSGGSRDSGSGGSGVVGWAVGWDVPGELHLMNIAVHPSYRRRGHARALLAELVARHL